MALRAAEKIESYIAHWLNFILHYAWLFILIFLLITAGLVGYIKDNLGVNTDTADMLSETLEWRQNYIAYQKAFPQFSDNLAIVIDGKIRDQVEDASQAIISLLEKNKDQFNNIYQLENSTFFRQNSLLYLDTDELTELTTELASVQPFLARIQADLNLRGLFSVITDAIEEADQEINLDRIFSSINHTVESQLSGERQAMSWHALMSQREISADDLRTVITLQPTLDYSKILPGETAIDTLRAVLAQANIEETFQVDVRLTGSVALAYEELGSVTRGAELGGLIALVTVTIILIVGLRSLSLVLATLTALISGLIWTAAFATFAIGELNMISVAFMVLYIGLGVDFAIHYCLRFRERNRHVEKKRALIESGSHVGSSLVVCALTTAIGFFAFLPTAYAGVAELGLISGTGMFISLFISLSFLPALISLLPIKHHQQGTKLSPERAWHRWPVDHAGTILKVTAALAVLSLFCLSKLSFDHNPIHLMDPETESVETYQDLLSQSTRSPLSISVLTDSSPQELVRKLSSKNSVDDVISLDSFIPDDQDEKLFLIEDLSLVMSLDENTDPIELTQTERQDALDQFITVLDKDKNRISQTGQMLLQNLKRLQTNADEQSLQALEVDLLNTLPGRLDRLLTSMEAEGISNETLPTNTVNRWLAKQDEKPIYRLQVFPIQDLDDNAALEAFVSEVREVTSNATGSPIINVEASRAVIQAFQIAFSLALIVISVLLFFLLDRKIDVLIALLPLLLAGLFTTAATVIFSIPFNFANIIALPLLLGIGVDSAVHMIHRYRSALPEKTSLLSTSTARAVLISALTTMCSFGNLAVSPHQGTASMGVLLTIGLTLTILTTLFVLPSLLTYFDERALRQAQTGEIQ